MTNYERIKNMKIEEMAKAIDDSDIVSQCDCCVYIDNCPNIDCKVGIKLWLESEAEE